MSKKLLNTSLKILAVVNIRRRGIMKWMKKKLFFERFPTPWFVFHEPHQHNIFRKDGKPIFYPIDYNPLDFSFGDE